MTESKYKRVISAITVGVVILFCFLIFTMVTQFVSIGIANKRNRELETEIEHYTQLKDESENVLEARKSRWWIERRARSLGYIYEGDEILD